MKDTDPVLRHPKTGTVHEAETPSDVYGVCGNNSSGTGRTPTPMTRAVANSLPGSKPCMSLACVAARRKKGGK